MTTQVPASMVALDVATSASFAVFRGIQNAVTSITATPVKVGLNAESFDTNNWFDTTNSRFLPTKAGYYHISAGVRFATSGSSCYVALNKNGALYSVGNFGVQDLGTISDIIYLNGSTDYVELYAQSTTTQNTVTTQTFMAGCLVRPD